MSSVMTKRDHALLVSDGFLITLGVASLAISLAFGLSSVQIAGAQPLIEGGSALIMFAAGIAGVVIAWRLHERKINSRAVIGGILGAFLGSSGIWIVAGLSWLLGLPLKLFTAWEYAGPVAALILVSIAVAALITWMLIDAARDLAAGRRLHVVLDRARIASAAVFAVLVAVSLYLVFAQPGPEQGEAPIWAIAGALIGAGVIAGADLANWLVERQQQTATPART